MSELIELRERIDAILNSPPEFGISAFVLDRTSQDEMHTYTIEDLAPTEDGTHLRMSEYDRAGCNRVLRVHEVNDDDQETGNMSR